LVARGTPITANLKGSWSNFDAIQLLPTQSPDEDINLLGKDGHLNVINVFTVFNVEMGIILTFPNELIIMLIILP
jgi:hypothetical protein